MLQPAGASGYQARGNPIRRLQLPDRDDPPALAAGHEDCGGPDRLHGAGSRPFQDVGPHHPGSLDHGLAALFPEQDAPPAYWAASQTGTAGSAESARTADEAISRIPHPHARSADLRVNACQAKDRAVLAAGFLNFPVFAWAQVFKIV